MVRISERLAPLTAVHTDLASRTPDSHLFAAYVWDIVHRLTADRDAALALFELRLEAVRRPSVASALRQWRQDGLNADVAFAAQMGRPAGRAEITMFHYAIDGFVLDQLTVPLDEHTEPEAVVDELVARLLSPQ
ncbi:Transcriptional regulator, TetR family [Leifsonia rubra CMS 76R]|nr:Transcriptional regulator, TetR family [Leifsonia rubra CMS 76R]